MKRNNLQACKLTQKFDLIEVMMKTRYHFCMRYKNWTLKNWKKIIWIDEISVIMSSRQGKTRVWRTFNEVHGKICTRRRFKEFSKFMWWSSFSYDKKNLYHIWKVETAAQKKTSVEKLKRINDVLKSTAKETWELKIFMRRMNLRNKADSKSKWKWDQNHDKMIRKNKEDINWYRYLDWPRRVGLDFFWKSVGLGWEVEPKHSGRVEKLDPTTRPENPTRPDKILGRCK